MLPRLPLLAAVAIAAPALAADPAADRLGRYNDGVVAIMKAKLPFAQRATRFEALVRDFYDMNTIAALVVGPAWATASPADKAAAAAALARHSAVQLARNFTNFSGERFTVDTAVQARGRDRIVKLTIGTDKKSDTLLYRMQAGTSGEWRIVDVVSGGVSQLAVQRADLASTVAAGGAKGLAQKLAEVDAKAK